MKFPLLIDFNTIIVSSVLAASDYISNAIAALTISNIALICLSFVAGFDKSTWVGFLLTSNSLSFKSKTNLFV